MRIGELSRKTGMSVRGLRYYEEQGLLRPERRASGYREFRESDVESVRRIRILIAAGVPTRVIAEVLPCMVDEGRYLAPTCAEMAEDLRVELERMNRDIAEREAARSILRAILATEPGADAEPARYSEV
ncbi:MerR family transcriptional regulator [Nocardia goodfellowii]|uniref:DNA-binding transcriptional MerR regulator n=1 Tax=Nocardia goodfellowii TaxID=882446 RepID=A0ABS4QPT8_9NOCA|nr:MerR family transcriptional regulator [Nocardia goodfellowii]MBP2192656.1 DNA-binding transcriptional MerR regulator [Nocardia goodfellowii]